MTIEWSRLSALIDRTQDLSEEEREAELAKAQSTNKQKKIDKAQQKLDRARADLDQARQRPLGG